MINKGPDADRNRKWLRNTITTLVVSIEEAGREIRTKSSPSDNKLRTYTCVLLTPLTPARPASANEKRCGSAWLGRLSLWLHHLVLLGGTKYITYLYLIHLPLNARFHTPNLTYVFNSSQPS
ncbi:hypothetical protein K445DRAFT_290856 [Daldinia sp. EC12]|nr:hypothetical protein K445DRAFT_290856 [Daldinia sp. EC12]